ncbi:MAG: hypothetical protein ACLTYP_03765 [Eubacterium sp.]|uniref:hypothetical protein n=1 Tax=Eubacterium sp. TaxID=142586 RepID=UPI0039925332
MLQGGGKFAGDKEKVQPKNLQGLSYVQNDLYKVMESGEKHIEINGGSITV